MRVFFWGMFRGRRAFRIRMLKQEEIAHNFSGGNQLTRPQLSQRVEALTLTALACCFVEDDAAGYAGVQGFDVLRVRNSDYLVDLRQHSSR